MIKPASILPLFILAFGAPAQFEIDSTSIFFEATMTVDSTAPLCGNPQNASVQSVRQIDTTIFSWDRSPFVPEVRVDTPAIHTSMMDPCSSLFVVDPFNYLAADSGNAVRVFAVQTSMGIGRYKWELVSRYSEFLEENTPPFEFETAFRAFGRKLGPILPPGSYDPGWATRAFHDDSYWYIRVASGTGDCLAGCIDWITVTYKVDSTGTTSVHDCSATMAFQCYDYIPPISVHSRWKGLPMGKMRFEYLVNGKMVARENRSTSVFLPSIP